MKLTLKSTFASTAVVAAVVAGATLATAPAYAVTLGSQLDFSATGKFTTTSADFYFVGLPNPTPNPTGLAAIAVNAAIGTTNAGSFTIDKRTGDFLSLVPILPFNLIKDLATFTLPAGGLSNFLFFGAGNNFNFKLTSFVNTTPTLYKYAGVFADGTAGYGDLTSQTVGNAANAYSSTLIAGTRPIPTPALLPGLIGLGLGIARKRKAATKVAAEV